MANTSKPQSIKEQEVLRTVPFFSDLTDSELSELGKSLVRRRFSAGQVIFHLGDPGGLLYIIETGRIKIFFPNTEGNEVVLAILGQDEFFGELALFDDSPRSATAETVENTTVYTLNRNECLRYLTSNPDLSIKMLSTLARRIRLMNEQISDVFFLDLPGRLARKLLTLAEDHGEEVENGVRIPMQLTQTDLAEMTGATRVSVNKALRRFRNAEWVSVKQKRFTIHNAEALEDLIQLSGG